MSKKESIQTADDLVDDVLTYALFPQIGLKFLKNRHNPDAFEPISTQMSETLPSNAAASSVAKNTGTSAYSVRVDGQVFEVEVAQSGELTNVKATNSTPVPQVNSAKSVTGQVLNSPLTGNIFKVLIKNGDEVNSGDVVIIMEAMKMETEIRASLSGVVSNISTKEGDAVQTGQPLLVIG